MEERILTVTDLNEYVRLTLAGDPMLQTIQLQGEISNFKRAVSGHLYFSLKDENSRIDCVMFRTAAYGLRCSPRDGMRVVLTGGVSLYTAAGKYQFYATGMREGGMGALYEAFERLKAKLQAEGLFDAAKKKPLPLLPRGVGIVTSATGAVVHDIQNVAGRRNPGVQLYLRPSAVQGTGAAAEIARGIAALDRDERIDVIIVGRGGGSLEELWAFNEEIVARAIYACKTPVVSAVGHETDFTIADFVSDVRAPTPSAAAELVVPRRDELLDTLDGLRDAMTRAQKTRVRTLRAELDKQRARLNALQPAARLRERRARLTALCAMLNVRAENALRMRRVHLAALEKRLVALSPQGVLQRGYALVTDERGNLAASAAGLRAGENISIRLRDGKIGARVTEGYNGGEEKTGL